MDTEHENALHILPNSELAEIGLLIRKFYQKNQSIWQTHCIDAQITSVQHALMNAVDRLGPSSLTEIGRYAAIDPATTRGVVDRLKARGMIAVTSSREDRRKVIVSLTDEARDYLQNMRAVMPDVAMSTLSPLNSAETIALRFLLDKVTSSEDGK